MPSDESRQARRREGPLQKCRIGDLWAGIYFWDLLAGSRMDTDACLALPGSKDDPGQAHVTSQEDAVRALRMMRFTLLVNYGKFENIFKY